MLRYKGVVSRYLDREQVLWAVIPFWFESIGNVGPKGFIVCTGLTRSHVGSSKSLYDRREPKRWVSTREGGTNKLNYRTSDAVTNTLYKTSKVHSTCSSLWHRARPSNAAAAHEGGCERVPPTF